MRIPTVGQDSPIYSIPPVKRSKRYRNGANDEEKGQASTGEKEPKGRPEEQAEESPPVKPGQSKHRIDVKI